MDDQWKTQLNIKYCTLRSVCGPGNVEYHCHSCHHDLCLQCKENHVIDLDTKDHIVTHYIGKFVYPPKHERCVRHHDQHYEIFCKTCNNPICLKCNKHRNHSFSTVKTAYKKKQGQQHELFLNIRSEILYNLEVLRTLLLSNIEKEENICKKEINNITSKMRTKAHTLKNLLDIFQSGVHFKCLRLLRHRLKKKKKTLSERHKYVIFYEQSANRAVQFLRLINKHSPQQIIDAPGVGQQLLLLLSLEIHMNDITEILSKVQITQREKRHVQNHTLYKNMSSSVLNKSLPVINMPFWYHISRKTADQIWISDLFEFTLINTTTNETIDRLSFKVARPAYRSFGSHTVNTEGELILANQSDIIKLCNDTGTTTTLFRFNLGWIPRCVYYSPFTQDLLIGISKTDNQIHKGMIIRCKNIGQPNESIELGQPGNTLYSEPSFITENSNGDIVVSDSRSHAVVVTDFGGRHRFTYRGHPSGSGFLPLGICTDVLLNILICDEKSNTVQIIDKKGKFVSYLLRVTDKSPGIAKPRSLFYDFNKHLLWVGSGDEACAITVHRYINRHLPHTVSYNSC